MIYSSDSGLIQVLSINGGAVSLILEDCDFNPDGAEGLTGFSTSKSEDYNYEITRTIYGNTNLAAPYSEQLYDFNWSLNLTASKYLTLVALLEQHHLNFSDPSTIQPFIRFINYRTIFQQRAPRTRARSTLFSLPTNLTAPSGYELFYSQHDIVINPPLDSVEELYIDGGLPFYQIEMSGTEAKLVPITEDI